MTAPPAEQRPAWVVPVLLVALFAVAYLVLTVATRERPQPPFPTQAVAVPTPSPTIGTPVQPNFGLALSATGLGPHGFGDPADTVVAALTALLGTPTEDVPDECPREQPARWLRWADLSVRLQSGRFVAYIEGIHYPPGPPPLAIPTSEGLAPGDPANRLFELYDRAAVTEVPAPQPLEQQATQYEISEGINHLTVIVEGPPEAGQVAAIAAGSLCP